MHWLKGKCENKENESKNGNQKKRFKNIHAYISCLVVQLHRSDINFRAVLARKMDNFQRNSKDALKLHFLFFLFLDRVRSFVIFFFLDNVYLLLFFYSFLSSFSQKLSWTGIYSWKFRFLENMLFSFHSNCQVFSHRNLFFSSKLSPVRK